MKDHLDSDYIEDIVNSINSIENFVKGVTYNDFINNEMMYEAVIRKLGIIGEACNNLSKEIKDKHTEIPWREIIGMRNIIIHNYLGVDLKIIWTSIKKDVPEFKGFISKLIKDIEDG